MFCSWRFLTFALSLIGFMLLLVAMALPFWCDFVISAWSNQLVENRNCTLSDYPFFSTPNQGGCVFPFRMANRLYYDCVYSRPPDGSATRLWCPTACNSERNGGNANLAQIATCPQSRASSLPGALSFLEMYRIHWRRAIQLLLVLSALLNATLLGCLITQFCRVDIWQHDAMIIAILVMLVTEIFALGIIMAAFLTLVASVHQVGVAFWLIPGVFGVTCLALITYATDLCDEACLCQSVHCCGCQCRCQHLEAYAISESTSTSRNRPSRRQTFRFRRAATHAHAHDNVAARTNEGGDTFVTAVTGDPLANRAKLEHWQQTAQRF